MIQVTKEELADALERQYPGAVRAMVTREISFARKPPNVVVSKFGPLERKGLWGWIGAWIGGKADPAREQAAVTAAFAAYSTLQRRVFSSLQTAPRLEAATVYDAVAAGHRDLDQMGVDCANRFGVLSRAAEQRLVDIDPEFAMAPSLEGGFRLWKGTLWVMHPLLEVQAILFHRSAISAGIEPREPERNQGAAAAVEVRLHFPVKARVLAWGESG